MGHTVSHAVSYISSRCLRILLLTLISARLAVAASEPQIILPVSGMVAEQLAVIVNDRDPLSVEIAEYYRQKRHIPEQNIIHISFRPGRTSLGVREFRSLRQVVEKQLPDDIQGYALSWAEPYRVGCMSISSAFALGFDKKYCASGCQVTAPSIYAGSNSFKPYDDFGLRPTMLLAAENIQQARQLIDRGVRADGREINNQLGFVGQSQPPGAAYLVETFDKLRSVRKVVFPAVQKSLGKRLPVNIERQTVGLENIDDIMFYFTGAMHVQKLATNRFLPGAMADHLTSTGGKLTDSGQMSALRWLEAGATGSYGTVVEPCNLLSKFPNPLPAIRRYTEGATLLEAYWKSVKMPGQGVFIGEPLASPYAGYKLVQQDDKWLLHSPVLKPGFYKVSTAEALDKPYSLLTSGVEVTGLNPHIELPASHAAIYKIERLEKFPSRPLDHVIN